MPDIIKPQSVEELCAQVARAATDKTVLEVTGTATKRALGRPVRAGQVLSTSRLTGITLYEREELVLSARPGTLRADVEQALAANAQQFAFEPPDLAELIGSTGRGTLAAMTALNLSGPRRIRAGAVRDHFLGFTAVSGRGEIFKSGSRVMKNVTGYDLPKLLCGSWGTLGVMSDVTFKVLPAAPATATLVIAGLDDHAAVSVMSRAMRSACDVSGAAHLPGEIAQLMDFAKAGLPDGALTCLRLEGIPESITARRGMLSRALEQDPGRCNWLDTEPAKALWRKIRDVKCFCNDHSRQVWRLSVPPGDGAQVLEHIAGVTGARGFYDWAGGLIWLDVAAHDHACAELIRGAIATVGGHAMLVRADEQVRTNVPVFEPHPPVLHRLNTDLKKAFDPLGILNPGRMYFNI